MCVCEGGPAQGCSVGGVNSSVCGLGREGGGPAQPAVNGLLQTAVVWVGWEEMGGGSNLHRPLATVGACGVCVLGCGWRMADIFAGGVDQGVSVVNCNAY